MKAASNALSFCAHKSNYAALSKEQLEAIKFELSQKIGKEDDAIAIYLDELDRYLKSEFKGNYQLYAGWNEAVYSSVKACASGDHIDFSKLHNFLYHWKLTWKEIPTIITISKKILKAEENKKNYQQQLNDVKQCLRELEQQEKEIIMQNNLIVDNSVPSIDLNKSIDVTITGLSLDEKAFAEKHGLWSQEGKMLPEQVDLIKQLYEFSSTFKQFCINLKNAVENGTEKSIDKYINAITQPIETWEKTNPADPASIELAKRLCVYLRENWSDYISVEDPAEASDKIITQILSIPSNSDNTVKQQNFFTAIEKGTETVIDIALMIGVCKVARKAMVALERSSTRVIQGEKVVQLPHQSNKITQKTHKQQQQTINKTLEQIEKRQVEGAKTEQAIEKIPEQIVAETAIIEEGIQSISQRLSKARATTAEEFLKDPSRALRKAESSATPNINPATDVKIINGKEVSLKEYWESLMRDAAHDSQIGQKSLSEACAGIVAEERGLLKGPIKRDPIGAGEFIDINGQVWDVKEGVSRTFKGRYIFEANELLKSVKRELLIGENIILDITRLEKTDWSILVEKLKSSLTQSEIERIIIITT